jgi:hypothetical protein
MKDAFFDKILAPMLQAMCDLAEQVGITLICYAEYKEGLTSISITEHVEPDAGESAQLVNHAAHVASFDKLVARCMQDASIAQNSVFLQEWAKKDDI